ncbi:hypothetical protein BV20DRAFT_636131 [Pilatotrama ljubarskyi]|nr:hypothetical protein BV20DRAFT_636131 [Pilatotrama ljubarskyi]
MCLNCEQELDREQVSQWNEHGDDESVGCRLLMRGCKAQNAGDYGAGPPVNSHGALVGTGGELGRRTKHTKRSIGKRRLASGRHVVPTSVVESNDGGGERWWRRTMPLGGIDTGRMRNHCRLTIQSLTFTQLCSIADDNCALEGNMQVTAEQEDVSSASKCALNAWPRRNNAAYSAA